MNNQRMYFSIGILLLLRIGLFVYFILIGGDVISPDSPIYLTLADNLLNYQIFSKETIAPFEPDFFRTPGYPFLLAILKYLGATNLYWVVFVQELLYCYCAWIFFRFGLPLFGKKITFLGLLFLLLEPAGFTNSKYILSEVLFLPFLYLGLFLIGFYLKKIDWRYLVLSGFLIGLGILVRPALLYISIIICFTLLAFDFRNKQRWLHVGLLFFTISLTISPWVVRNQQYDDGFFFSGQASNMFANYHVPSIWQSTKGIPFLEGQKIISSKVKSTIQQQEQNLGHEISTIEKFRIQQRLALHELSKYPVEYSKNWILGVLNTMLGTQTTNFFQVLKITNTPLIFEEIKNLNSFGEVWEYFASQNIINLFHLILRVTIAGFALIGILAIIFKHKDCFLWIVMLVNLYFMFIPGPMGYGRFRFPVEVFWFVQSCYGLLWVISFLKKPMCHPINHHVFLDSMSHRKMIK
ncbi:MAG: glycosyltransferase family 39 protein [Methylococcales bacterium]|nr:glycosyltransferase family 39 protein [Methylococcales bacterium]